MKWNENDRCMKRGFAKCALMQTCLRHPFGTSSLRASSPVSTTGNNRPTVLSVVASFPSAHEGRSGNDMRVAANHKQGLENDLSTCTEPCLQGSIATLENQLVGLLPHTKPNPRRIGCAARFPGLSGQSVVSLITAKDRPLMRGVHGAV